MLQLKLQRCSLNEVIKESYCSVYASFIAVSVQKHFVGFFTLQETDMDCLI